MVVPDVDSKLLEELEVYGIFQERRFRLLMLRYGPDLRLNEKTEGKGSGKGRSKITGKRGAHKEKKREEEDDDTRTVYERSKGMMEFVLLLSVDVNPLPSKIGEVEELFLSTSFLAARHCTKAKGKHCRRYQGFKDQARKRTTMKLLTLEEYIKNVRDEGDFEEFNRLSSINDDLFTYEVEIVKPTYAPCVEQQTGNQTKKELENYEWKMCYEECEKIYAEAVIFIDRRLARLIDVTVEQWLDLKYGDRETMDENVMKEVIATLLIRSYKQQFKDYLEIRKQRDTYAREVDMEYNPCNMARVDDEVKLTDEELFNLEDEDLSEMDEIGEIFSIETDLFNFETSLCKAFNEFNYLLKVNTDLFTSNISGFKTYDEFKNGWINEWNKGIPWVPEEPWSKNGVPYELINHVCEPFCSRMERLNGPLVIGMMKDYVMDEALKQKAIYEGSWGNATQGVMDFYAWNGKTSKDDDIYDKQERKRDSREDIGDLVNYLIPNNAPYYANGEEMQYKERCGLLGNPHQEPPTCKTERFEVVKYSFGPSKRYIAIKEYGYYDWATTEENACHAYQDIFHKMDEGWFVTRAE
ncbi:hypothetical protein Tco_0453483 [Tanacetum coccineum]